MKLHGKLEAMEKFLDGVKTGITYLTTTKEYKKKIGFTLTFSLMSLTSLLLFQKATLYAFCKL